MTNAFGKIIEQAKAMRESLKSIRVVGEAGAGMVKIEMDGRHVVHHIEIDDEIYQAGKTVVLGLIVAAVNNASEKAEKAMQDKMAQFTTGLGLPPNFSFPAMPGDEKE